MKKHHDDNLPVDEDPLETLFQIGPVLMHFMNTEGTLTKVSEFWAKTLGYDVSEMLGKKSVDFLSEESRQRAITYSIPQTIRKGHVHNVDYDFICKDGSILPVLLSAVAIFDRFGAHQGNLGIIFDNREAKSALAALHHNQRVAAIGEMVGGVTHNFNNLLAIVQGSAELLQDVITDPEQVELIDNILEATSQGRDLIRQMLAYSRKEDRALTNTDVTDVAETASKMLKALLPPHAVFQSVAIGRVPQVYVDKTQLETVIVNLVKNAKDALPEGVGHIQLQVSAEILQTRKLCHNDDMLESGSYTTITVRDDGAGMSPETLSNVFEPFFTTKPVGKGTGLGLATVYSFVKECHGAIEVDSTLGMGTTIKIFLPAVVQCGTPT